MLQRFLHNRTAMFTVAIVLLTALVGIFAPFIAPNDPYETDILNKFAGFSAEYPLGTDNLGRCMLSRMIYGIRPTLGLAVLTMLGTIGLGALMGLLAGYFRGIPEEIIMRTVDVMLSFPSQIMVFAVVALLGINVQNVILANVFTDHVPVIAIATQKHIFAKTISNIREVKARGAYVVLLVTEDTAVDEGIADVIIRIPKEDDKFTVFPIAVVLQLIAYYASVQKGLDVDQPRNLAKSVTVE